MMPDQIVDGGGGGFIDLSREVGADALAPLPPSAERRTGSRSTEYRRRRAIAEGREYGVRPCERCQTLIDLKATSNARKYCEACRKVVKAEWRKADRQRRRESMREYLREYYQKNHEALRAKERERRNTDEGRARGRTYYHRNIHKMRTYRREQYTKKNSPTVHETALEMWGFKSTERSGRGIRVRKCKCGCGLPINAAHVAVLRLFSMGYSRDEIAQSLGVHPVEVSKLKLDGEARTWPWYRRGHSNLATVAPQPLTERRVLTRKMELLQLTKQQDVELAQPERIGYKHMGRVQAASYSLDATLRGTENFTLGDMIASGSEDSVFEEMEVHQAGTLVKQLERAGVSVESAAELIHNDPSLAEAFAHSLDTGQLSERVLALLKSRAEVS